MQTLFQDLKYALRAMRSRPLFSAVVVTTLALGVGANSTIFAVMEAILWSPPAGVRNAEKLIWVGSAWRDSGRMTGLSYPDYIDVLDATPTDNLADVAAFAPTPFSLSSGGEPERLNGQVASATYFTLLGARPAAGRFFSAGEDFPGGTPVAVLSDGLWRRRFGADPAVVGSTILLNGAAFVVAGIAPARFRGALTDAPADIWVPLGAAAIARPGSVDENERRDALWLTAIARTAGEASRASAIAAVSVLGARLAAAYPGAYDDRVLMAQPFAGGLMPGNRGEARSIFVLLMGVTALVLLVACANIANLLLARAAARQREIGIRLAIGSGRGRIIRQLLTESLALAAFGGIAGLLLSLWAVDFLLAYLGDVGGLQRLEAGASARGIGFTLAITLFAAVTFGLAPALHATRGGLTLALKSSGGLGERISGSRLQRGFVVAQMSLSVVLLVAAGLFLRALQKAGALQLGFDPANIATVTFDLELQGLDAEERATFTRTLLDEARALPGVVSAAAANLLPLGGRIVGMGISAAGEGDASQSAWLNAVTPGYFATLRIPLVAGRDFDDSDVAGAPAVAIVSETAARRLWGADQPIGRRFSLSGPAGPFIDVIGVARDSKFEDATESPHALVYLPLTQRPVLPGTTLLARSAGAPAPLLPALRERLNAQDPGLPVYDEATLEGVLRERVDKQRALGALLSAFGGLALALAALGLYGVVAFQVGQRTREIGIRVALGAGRDDVLRLIVGDGLRLAVRGVAVGLVLAVPLSLLLSRSIHGAGAADATTFVLVAMLLTGVAAIAAWVPARRAATVAPIAALRDG